MAELGEVQRPGACWAGSMGSRTVRALVTSLARLALHLASRCLPVAASVFTVDLLGEAELFVGACIWGNTLCAVELALL